MSLPLASPRPIGFPRLSYTKDRVIYRAGGGFINHHKDKTHRKKDGFAGIPLWREFRLAFCGGRARPPRNKKTSGNDPESGIMTREKGFMCHSKKLRCGTTE
jgi:hypothetical protein